MSSRIFGRAAECALGFSGFPIGPYPIDTVRSASNSVRVSFRVNLRRFALLADFPSLRVERTRKRGKRTYLPKFGR